MLQAFLVRAGCQAVFTLVPLRLTRTHSLAAPPAARLLGLSLASLPPRRLSRRGRPVCGGPALVTAAIQAALHPPPPIRLSGPGASPAVHLRARVAIRAACLHE